MNIESLQMFCLVLDEGSISQAARLSYVSQPAVTRQIHQLENDYGALLFDRTDGAMKVTEAGKALYPFAKAIVRDYRNSKEAVKQAVGDYNKNLVVGASFTIGEYLLPSLLGRFKKKWPELNVTLMIKNTPGILEDLTNDVIDMALVEGLVDKQAFLVEKFADDDLILVCAPNHEWGDEVQIEDIVDEQMIWREADSGTRQIVKNSLEQFHILEKIESYMELGSTQAIKSAVSAGLGIAILPRIAVAAELRVGLLREVTITDMKIIRNLWLVRKNQRFHKNSVTQFLDFIRI
ncbi:LysR family transcriptional regulator [Neobacillus citreus]|uniref:LysR family transcriptional regulator n=1 Tax=Neobacillus citreus TaxID=2833578 RepID=A0A942T1U4_9BACI|nr:LysR family transcriptional regulator [Neobacillus citreus]MCH6265019.1 LysR family transcriptional regulator [Neobacillus citreus]